MMNLRDVSSEELGAEVARRLFELAPTEKLDRKFYARGNRVYFGNGSEEESYHGITTFNQSTFPDILRDACGVVCSMKIAEILNEWWEKHEAKKG